jgi:hypothetical protein
VSDPSDIVGGSSNPFAHNYQHVYRPWIYYQLNDNVRFSLSPIAFWETWTSAVESGTVRKIQPEFRICPQITLTNKIGRISIDQRYRYEFRFLGTRENSNSGIFSYDQGMDFPASNNKMRMRYFVRGTMPLGKHTKLENNTWYAVAWNELFLGLGKNTSNDKLVDQNRTFCLLGYKPTMTLPMRFELGYGFQYANRVSSSYSGNVLTETGHRFEKNHILQVNMIFENFNKIFASKKKK